MVPCQVWAVIHAGELLVDGRPRFRTVLMVVARQNGKTHLLRTLALYWAFVERWPLTLGMSTNLEYAAEAWQAAVDKAQSTPALDRKSTRLNSSHVKISYAVFCLKKKKQIVVVAHDIR